MPLRLPGSDFAGAISISGPSARMRNPDSKEHFLALLAEATKEALLNMNPPEFVQNTAGTAASSSSSKT